MAKKIAGTLVTALKVMKVALNATSLSSNRFYQEMTTFKTCLLHFIRRVQIFLYLSQLHITLTTQTIQKFGTGQPIQHICFTKSQLSNTCPYFLANLLYFFTKCYLDSRRRLQWS